MNDEIKKWLLVPPGVFALLLVVFCGKAFLGLDDESRPPNELLEIALTSEDGTEQQRAAVELADLGRPGLKHMERLLLESPSNGVRVVAIQGLAAQWHYESMPILLDQLDDPSPLVRNRAKVAVEHLLGVTFGHPVDQTDQERKAAVSHMRQEWDNLQASPGFEAWKTGKQAQSS